MKTTISLVALALATATTAQAATAATAKLLAADKSCAGLPTHAEFKAALQAAQKVLPLAEN